MHGAYVNPVVPTGPPNVSDTVYVPDELFEWAHTAKIQSTLYEVKRDSKASLLQVIKDGQSARTAILIHANNEQVALTARKLLE